MVTFNSETRAGFGSSRRDSAECSVERNVPLFMSRGLFVTGTDTGVGKTTVACALTSAWAARGIKVGVMKPCETGDGNDAERLVAASGRPLPLELVRPYAFSLPLSPQVAASRENKDIEIENLQLAFQTLATDADWMVVEGAGGLLVPIAKNFTMADLAKQLDLALLIVARPGLGTINHTLLTVQAALTRNLKVSGFVFSSPHPEPEAETNARVITEHSAVPFLGLLPAIATENLATSAQTHLPRALALLTR